MIIQLKEVSYQYPGSKQEALNKVTIDFKQPQFCSVVGPNGSGKSTLLKLIFNAYCKPKLYSNRITFLNQKPQLSYVPPIFKPSFTLAALEFVIQGFWKFDRYKMTQYTQDQKLKAKNILSLLKVEFSFDKPITECSLGEFQILLIARALVSNPNILLLDESLSSLDLKHQVTVLDFLKKQVIGLDGLVLMTSHDLSTVSAYSDQVLWMKQGRIIDCGPTLKFFNQNFLSQFYELDSTHSKILTRLTNL